MPRSNHGPLSYEKARDRIRYAKMHQGKRWKSQTYNADSRENFQDAWRDFCDWRDRQEENARLEAKARETQEETAKREFIQTASNSLAVNAQYHRLIGDNETAGTIDSLIANLAECSMEQLAVIGSAMEKLTETSYAKTAANTIRELRRNNPEVEPYLTAEAQAHRLLDHYRMRVDAGQISAGRYGKLRNSLNFFLDWYGRSRSIMECDRKTASDFYSHLVNGLNGRNNTTYSDHLQSFRQFIEDCDIEIEEFDAPGNLRSKKYSIEKKKYQAKAYTVDEAKKLLNHATDRTRLILLLLLNCGMTQKDIADLDAEEINWEEGRIIRKLSKTRKKENVPTVNYPLWTETFKLLKELGNREGTVILNQNGKPLYQSGIKEDGTEFRIDNVASAYKRLIKTAKKRNVFSEDWKKTLRQFRSTGATMIERSEYRGWRSHYLGHAPRGVGEQHYIEYDGAPHEGFDQAVLWLGMQFGQA